MRLVRNRPSLRARMCLCRPDAQQHTSPSGGEHAAPTAAHEEGVHQVEHHSARRVLSETGRNNGNNYGGPTSTQCSSCGGRGNTTRSVLDSNPRNINSAESMEQQQEGSGPIVTPPLPHTQERQHAQHMWAPVSRVFARMSIRRKSSKA